jgi:hypothetical protein
MDQYVDEGMDDFAHAPLDHLEWVNSGTDDAFQLSAGDRTFATLEWKKGTETVAQVSSVHGPWTLRRRGFLAPAIVVRDSVQGTELAALSVRWRESLVHLAGGPTFRWVDSGFWSPRWKFIDEQGAPVIQFEPRQGHGRGLERGLLSFGPGAQPTPELLLLLVLGWYFVVLVWAEQEGESIGAFVTTMAGGGPKSGTEKRRGQPPKP